MNKDQFSYYISFFHDGSLNGFTYDKNHIEFYLNSACLELGENRHNIKLDEVNRVVGKLILRGVRKVFVNDEVIRGELRFGHSDGEVLDFDVKDHKVELGIEWDFSDYSMIEIEANQILWEDALNDVTVDLTGLWTGAPRASND